MPKVSDVYAGDYVNASQLPTDKHVTALITSAITEIVGREQNAKLVLDLSTTDGRPWSRRVVLNKRNSLILASAYGDDTDAWIDKAIELWSGPTTFDGKDTLGVMLAPVGNGSTDSTAIAMPAPAPGGDLNDEVPWA